MLLVDRLNADGFVIVPNVLDQDKITQWTDRLANAIEQATIPGRLETPTQEKTAIYGSRNLLAICPAVVTLLHEPSLASLCAEILGNEFGVVRGLYFDKPPGATWSLPWHQDLTIAVSNHIPAEDQNIETNSSLFGTEGFSKPTIKAGVHHVEAPTSLLEQMLTVRIHLDAMHAQNGPVLARKGSHRSGKLIQGQVPPKDEMVQIHCNAGDVMLMRPLLSHSSIASVPDSIEHRRTIHLELSPVKALCSGYRWHSFVPLY